MWHRWHISSWSHDTKSHNIARTLETMLKLATATSQVWKDNLHHCSWVTICHQHRTSLFPPCRNQKQQKKTKKMTQSWDGYLKYIFQISLEKHRYEESQKSSEETREEVCWDKCYQTWIERTVCFLELFSHRQPDLLKFSFKMFLSVNPAECKMNLEGKWFTENADKYLQLGKSCFIGLLFRFIELLSSFCSDSSFHPLNTIF